MPGGIFICYRRDQGDRHAAGRLFQSMKERFPGDQVFIDIDSIDIGLDFQKVIQDRVQAAGVLLVVIGPNWLDVKDRTGQRRLDNAHDYVRIEIEAALQREIRVIPVLIDGAEMPQADDLPVPLRPLILRNAFPIAHDTFTYDAERLATALSRILAPAPIPLAPPIVTPQPGGQRPGLSDEELKEAKEQIAFTVAQAWSRARFSSCLISGLAVLLSLPLLHYIATDNLVGIFIPANLTVLVWLPAIAMLAYVTFLAPHWALDFLVDDGVLTDVQRRHRLRFKESGVRVILGELLVLPAVTGIVLFLLACLGLLAILLVFYRWGPQGFTQ